MNAEAEYFAGKLLSWAELSARLSELRAGAVGVRDGGGIVFTNGCFDVIHAGHVRYLRAAAAEGEVLVVGLNADASVRRLKGAGRPIYPVAERAEILAAFSFVDFVVVFETDSVEPLVRVVQPNVLVKGGDYASDAEVVGGEFVRSYGGRIARVGLVPGCSTTGTLARLAGDDLGGAAGV